MIIGIGTDICKIDRIAKLIDKQGEKFIRRILTEDERVGEVSVAYLAKRFAAKEACAKALGCGIGAQLSFQDIEVHRLEEGQPILKVESRPDMRFHLSLSDEDDYAVAMVVVEEK